MDYPICPSCKGENTYHDSIQFVCPDCGHEWTGNEAEEHDDDQLIVKDSNGNLLADGDDVLDAATVEGFVTDGPIDLAAGTTIDGDVIPYTSVIGSRGFLSGLNLVGLKRRSFKKDEIKTLRNVYRLLFAPEGTFNERLLEVSETYNKNALVKEILSFLKENLNRPLVHPKSGKH